MIKGHFGVETGASRVSRRLMKTPAGRLSITFRAGGEQSGNWRHLSRVCDQVINGRFPGWTSACAAPAGPRGDAAGADPLRCSIRHLCWPLKLMGASKLFSGSHLLAVCAVWLHGKTPRLLLSTLYSLSPSLFSLLLFFDFTSPFPSPPPSWLLSFLPS